MADHDVDLFVIGAGSGGVRAARIAAEHGARVMVAEEYRLGGTCVIRGCVPKKLLVYASRFRGEFEDAAGFGWTVPQASFDWPTLIANKDKEIARLEAAYGATSNKAGVKIVKSRAVIADPHTVQLANGERVRAGHILISTGGTPSLGDPIPGHRACDLLERGVSSAGIAAAHRDPGRRLYRGGVRRHLCRARLAGDAGLSRREHPARLRRRCAPAPARRDGAARHQRDLTGARSRRSRRPAATIRCICPDGNHVPADQVMFATGRVPNVAKLGLEEAGVTLAKNGGIAVDDYSRTVGRQHLRGRRRHQPHQSDAGRDPRGPCVCRHRVRRQADRGRSHQCADRGVLRAGGRRGRPDRGASARAAAADRYLQGQFPADEGDAVRPRHDAC